jgi:hypothetical protein
MVFEGILLVFSRHPEVLSGWNKQIGGGHGPFQNGNIDRIKE